MILSGDEAEAAYAISKPNASIKLMEIVESVRNNSNKELKSAK